MKDFSKEVISDTDYFFVGNSQNVIFAGYPLGTCTAEIFVSSNVRVPHFGAFVPLNSTVDNEEAERQTWLLIFVTELGIIRVTSFVAW